MVLRENPDADLPGHHPRGARKTELGTRCVTDVISSLDPADTHHARSNNCQVKSLLLQIKRQVRAMMGFKSFWSAAVTLACIELMHMIRKGQLKAAGRLCPAQQF